MPLRSITDANGAMALPEAKPRTAVMVRIASAAVLIPPVIAAVITGSPYFEALILIGAMRSSQQHAKSFSLTVLCLAGLAQLMGGLLALKTCGTFPIAIIFNMSAV